MLEVAAGIWQIVLPTPWPVGPVNAYLIDDEPLTLVDPGPIHGPSFEALDAALAERGYRAEDLERVVVSHQHPDHWGAADQIVRRSEAELCALAELSPWLSDYPASVERDDRFADELLRAHGHARAPGSPGAYSGEELHAERAIVTRPLRDGDVLRFAGRDLCVLHRPGHSRSDTVLYDASCAVMLGADHIMAWPSVPMLSAPLDNSAMVGRPRALTQYKASLRATREMDLAMVLPGHGEPVGRPADVIGERLRYYDSKTEEIRTALAAGPGNAMELAHRTRGPFPESSAFFVLCDTLGYLEELLDTGTVAEVDVDGAVRFGPA